MAGQVGLGVGLGRHEPNPSFPPCDNVLLLDGTTSPLPAKPLNPSRSRRFGSGNPQEERVFTPERLA